MPRRKRHRINVLIAIFVGTALIISSLCIVGLLNHKNLFEIHFDKNNRIAYIEINEDTMCFEIKVVDFSSPFRIILSDNTGKFRCEVDFSGVAISGSDYDYKLDRRSCYIPKEAGENIKIELLSEVNENDVSLNIWETSYCDN
ncbi:hypothetical protein SAMN06298216_1080 [Spirosomataceae bacterium TFI 002]|nr:hypothetical protein SAMN06298216_1080 [Spirosomataceae bacterium TFI 002]